MLYNAGFPKLSAKSCRQILRKVNISIIWQHFHIFMVLWCWLMVKRQTGIHIKYFIFFFSKCLVLMNNFDLLYVAILTTMWHFISYENPKANTHPHKHFKSSIYYLEWILVKFGPNFCSQKCLKLSKGINKVIPPTHKPPAVPLQTPIYKKP